MSVKKMTTPLHAIRRIQFQVGDARYSLAMGDQGETSGGKTRMLEIRLTGRYPRVGARKGFSERTLFHSTFLADVSLTDPVQQWQAGIEFMRDNQSLLPEYVQLTRKQILFQAAEIVRQQVQEARPQHA